MTEAARRLVVLDRDGVINVDVPGRYVCSAQEWIAIEGSLAAMGRLSRAGFAIFVVSNQSGIGRGLFAETELARMHAKLLDGLAAHGGELAGWFYCPHLPSDGCRCRKPAPGLLEQVQAAAGCSLSGVPFVGDKWSDLLAARAMHMRGMLVATGHGRQTLRDHPAEIGEFYADLAAAADALVNGAPARRR
ncbi:MAG TPA: D-glycero-beta-D-manno-heptose 1,7-bisphosphate 7-phosphatase [Gammaproteobacteria bacterium]|nr:D-glycero-beta-D-manno-heptose 1,7-bisphosphate 7-phosphatase [Gammaproteobacteria bacterium]